MTPIPEAVSVSPGLRAFENSVTIAEALRAGKDFLTSAGIEDADMEAEVLLRNTLNVDRAYLYLALGETLSIEHKSAFRALLERRVTREPNAYIVGHKEFYGIDLFVDGRVLIPRPETEILVEGAIQWASGRGPVRIADIGTGSGAIAIALAMNLPHACISASDVSSEALQVAALNLSEHGLEPRVTLLQGDLLAALPCAVDLIVANLPYITSSQMAGLAPEVRIYEPSLALEGGIDGLDPVRRLLAQAPGCLAKGGAVLLEIGQGQAEAASELAKAAFPSARISLFSDLAGIRRVLQIETDI